jgi:hypothetical protein
MGACRIAAPATYVQKCECASDDGSKARPRPPGAVALMQRWHEHADNESHDPQCHADLDHSRGVAGQGLRVIVAHIANPMCPEAGDMLGTLYAGGHAVDCRP